jgi:hypothetical protein
MNRGYAIVGYKKNDKNKYGLIDNKGKTVLEAKYDYIGVNHIDKGYVMTMLNSLYGIVNLKSGKVIEPKYTSIVLMDTYIRTSAIVNGKEKFGILFYNGKLIEPAYDWIHHFQSVQGVIGMVEINGKFGLIGADGKYVLEPKYDEIREFNDGLAHVKLGNKYGYLKADGSFLTAIEYDDITAFNRGMAYVQKDGKWGIMNPDGSYKFKPIYDWISISDDKIEAIINGEKKLLNSDGTSKYPEGYEYMYPFASIEGATKFKKNGKEVILDASLKPIFKMDFDKIWDFEDGVARIELKGKIGYLSINDKYVVNPIYDNVYKEAGNYYSTKSNELYGAILPDGTVIKPMSESPIKFSGDYGIIYVSQKQTYIDKKGTRITKDVFDYCYPFSEGFGRVLINGKTNYVSTTGKLMPRDYNFGEDFKNGYALVHDEGRYKYIGKDGSFAFGGAKFMIAKSFSNGLAAVFENAKWGYIDTTGKLVIQPQFEWAYSFDEKLAPVVKSGKIGFIDKTGKIVIEPVYERADEFVNGIASVWKNGKYSYVTSKGEIKTDISQNKNYIFKDGVSPARTITKDGRYYWGYIKTDGSWLVEPEYDYVTDFTNGKGMVWKDNKQGEVTKDGKITWK